MLWNDKFEIKTKHYINIVYKLNDKRRPKRGEKQQQNSKNY